MLGFYQVTERLYDLFIEQGFNTITLDEEQEIDLKRQSIYPLAHIIPSSSSFDSSTNSFSFILIVLDLTDFNKTDSRDTDLMFYGIDNRQDILHSLFEKLRNVCEGFSRGVSFTENMQLTYPNSVDPFIAEFDNILTGWTTQVTITIPSNATIC